MYMTRAGLKTLAWRVLGKEVEKPKRVTMSRWDNLRLNYRYLAGPVCMC